MLEAVEDGKTLSVDMLTKPEYRKALHLGESKRADTYRQICDQQGIAIMMLRDRLAEDPVVNLALGNDAFQRASAQTMEKYSDLYKRLADHPAEAASETVPDAEFDVIATQTFEKYSQLYERLSC